MDLIDIIESRRFLGAEFLTWLWFQCEENGGQFDLPGIGPVLLSFDDRIVLEAFLEETEQSRLVGGDPSAGIEAKTALCAGKRVASAKLRLRRDEQEFVFTISGSEFHFGSVRLPSTERDDMLRLFERIELIEDLDAAWGAIYRLFLEVRLSGAWSNEERALRRWAQVN
jgi:recombination associated protein RdgC